MQYQCGKCETRRDVSLQIGSRGKSTKLMCSTCGEQTTHVPVSKARLTKGRVSNKAYKQVSRYRVPREVLIFLRGRATEYGGVSGALQVAMELLFRFPDAHKSSPKSLPKLSGERIGISFKIPERTIRQIDSFKKNYDKMGDIIHAASLLLDAGPKL